MRIAVILHRIVDHSQNQGDRQNYQLGISAAQRCALQVHSPLSNSMLCASRAGGFVLMSLIWHAPYLRPQRRRYEVDPFIRRLQHDLVRRQAGVARLIFRRQQRLPFHFPEFVGARTATHLWPPICPPVPHSPPGQTGHLAGQLLARPCAHCFIDQQSTVWRSDTWAIILTRPVPRSLRHLCSTCSTGVSASVAFLPVCVPGGYGASPFKGQQLSIDKLLASRATTSYY